MPDGMTELAAQRPRLLLSGLDSLYVSCFLDMKSGGRLDWDDLLYRKEKLKQARRDEVVEIELGSERFALQPYSRPRYKLTLRNDAFEIALAELMQPCCYVQCFSRALWQEGFAGLLDRLTGWIASMGFTPIRPHGVSRADWAFDYDLPVVDFTTDHVTSRAAKDSTWRQSRNVQTLSFGTGDIVVRLYDKVAEIEQASDKAWFHELWGQQENVWRIEFQVRSERLKAAGIRSTDNIGDLQSDLLRELATGHTQLRRPSTDSNRSRWPLHPLWRALQADIAALPQTGLVRHLDPRLPLDWRTRKISQSIYGQLKGLAATHSIRTGDGVPMSLNDLLDRLPGFLEPFHDEQTWNDQIDARITKHGLGQW